jgi:hypothetical protein
MGLIVGYPFNKNTDAMKPPKTGHSVSTKNWNDVFLLLSFT